MIWVHLVILTNPNMTLLKCKGQLLEYEGSNELSWPIWNSLWLKWEARFVEQRCFSVNRTSLWNCWPNENLESILPQIHVIVKVFFGVVPNPLRVCVCGLCWPKAFQGKKLRAHPRFSFFSAHPRRGFPERIWSNKNWNTVANYLVVSNIFVFTWILREMIQFDEHIFQIGWFNHQLVNHLKNIPVCFVHELSNDTHTHTMVGCL